MTTIGLYSTMVQFLYSSLTILAALLLATSASGQKVCVAQNSKTDDTITIIQAFNDCKAGGTVSLPKEKTYNIKSLIKVTSLKNVKIDFAGKIILPLYDPKFKGGSAYLEISGDNVHLSGGGTIVGNGQSCNFKILNAHRGHIAITGAENVIFENVYLNTRSTGKNFARNTDASGVTSSKNIIFRNSQLTVGDDCTAINAAVTNVTVTGIKCYEGHGFNIGSLGHGQRFDFVSNIYFTNNECHSCQNGVRIKTVSGEKGAVSDVRFQNVQLYDTVNPVAITTHYFCEQNKNCNNDQSLTISNVVIDRITG
ncbi:hypothetical protein CU097_001851 [Rhizopus azygosporus]|uniref:Uncharacterized protein n=1 Tax=Rhizopus azygosporus TaxID=86630 RepID=A0A367ISB2_RHIAZ|nr:hypothetical protein CU097_001851 [Rhizopus azygosporus]